MMKTHLFHIFFVQILSILSVTVTLEINESILEVKNNLKIKYNMHTYTSSHA